MAFKASKERYKRTEPTAEGKQLMYSAAVRDWYYGQIKSFIKAMSDDYRKTIGELYDSPAVKQHYAMDASINFGKFAKAFKSLSEKWTERLLSRFAEKTASSMCIKVDKHSFSSVKDSLETIGVKEPRGMSKSSFEAMMEMYTHENVALIKSIPVEFHSKVERAVWNSLTSPEGTEQGAYGVYNAIADTESISKERAEFIARDQTAKLNSSLNNARMESAGISKFVWYHSSAGKVPRKCHQAWDGRTFSTIGGPTDLYEVMDDGSLRQIVAGDDGAREGDIAKPGHAINCRCRARPVIDV